MVPACVFLSLCFVLTKFLQVVSEGRAFRVFLHALFCYLQVCLEGSESLGFAGVSWQKSAGKSCT